MNIQNIKRVSRPLKPTNCLKGRVRQGLFLYGLLNKDDYINFSAIEK